ncbi:MAG TPA: aldolase/citrate lyase family protein [Actinoplanes sp.]|nr:aldolase/citrate lyase family protein [Actinoplanes sp.]
MRLDPGADVSADPPRLSADDYAELDQRLAAHDAFLARRYPGEPAGRQPVHTVYVPADQVTPDLVARWATAALAALDAYPPLPFDATLNDRVRAKLAAEPIEDLRVDFEDGYGVRDDADEDAAVTAAAAALREGPLPPFVGIRIKSLEAATRHRALRTLDLFLAAYDGPVVITLPKVSDPVQVEAMAALCEKLETPDRPLRFEVQVELPAAVLGADGTATVARLITAAAGRCAGLHFGTYDYSAAVGVAAAYQALDHPAADHAKAVMQAAAAGTGVRLSDGSTNILPVGDAAAVHAAWALHTRLVRRSLERGFYQGWDLHPAQLPTRYAATYAFFADGRDAAVTRLRRYLDRRAGGILDEPATARALAGFLLRGLDCGALGTADIAFSRAELAQHV